MKRSKHLTPIFKSWLLQINEQMRLSEGIYQQIHEFIYQKQINFYFKLQDCHQYSPALNKRINYTLMTEVISALSPLSSNPRKGSKADKQAKIQDQREKLSQMINQFYQKTKCKIEKTLLKDSKKTFLLCKQLFGAISLYPQQQLYEVTRLNDVLFNQITILNQKIVNFLKQIERLREKLGFQLNIQKQRSIIKQEKNQMGESHITFLRKINFKKEKLSLGYKLNDIDVLNKKLMKCEQTLKNENQIRNSCILEIEGKRLENEVLKYSKIWFESKKKYYLLCIILNSDRQVKMQIYNDKLQPIALFSKSVVTEILTIATILQIGNYIYFISPHKISRINLINQSEQIAQYFTYKIQRGQVYQNGLLLWTVDVNENQSLLFLSDELQIYQQIYLKISIKIILNDFKMMNNLGEQAIYYLVRDQNNINSLYQLKDMQISMIIRDIGWVDEVIHIKRENVVQYVVFRKNNLFYKFSMANPVLQPLKIDIESGESIVKCCILGEHMYALHQGGKYILQCHFRDVQLLQ